MIASEIWHQNLSDYNQLLFKKIFEVDKKENFSSKKMRNSGKHWTTWRVKLLFCGYYAGGKTKDILSAIPHGFMRPITYEYAEYLNKETY